MIPVVALAIDADVLANHDFGISNYGDESDWNIHLLPAPGFEDFISDAIPYQSDNWYADASWPTDEQGHFLIEAEITPDEHRYGNPWFTNNNSQSVLLHKLITAYGPFVREEAHAHLILGPLLSPLIR